MKNISKLVLASLFALTLAACGSKPAETTETATDSVAVVDSTTTTEPVAADTTVTTPADSAVAE